MTETPSPLAAAWAQRFGSEPASQAPPPAPEPVGAADLASQLSARLCHDFVSPASAIVSGLDLLDDPSASDMREDAMNLISASAKKLVDLLAFSRVAFGSSASAESFDTRELERLTRGVYAHVRPELAWRVEPPVLAKVPARTLLNLAQIAATALPTGGVATVTCRIEGAAAEITAVAEGARARLRPEVTSGLKGERLEGGLGGHWVQAYFLHQLATSAGGRIDLAAEEGRVVLRARTPA